jgi:putative transposase
VSAFIEEHRARFGVEPICRTLGVSASAYYQRATGERSARAVEDERLLERIRPCTRPTTRPMGTGGCGRRCCEGERVPRCQVQRLMREHGIQGAKRRGKPWRTTTPIRRRSAAGPGAA